MRRFGVVEVKWLWIERKQSASQQDWQFGLIKEGGGMEERGKRKEKGERRKEKGERRKS